MVYATDYSSTNQLNNTNSYQQNTTDRQQNYQNYNSGSTHEVSGYTNSNGTYVAPHLSGNPGSGVHCKNNICQHN